MAPIAFGCVPDTDDAETRRMLTEICTIIGAAVGADIQPHIAPSPQQLAADFAAGRVQLAWASPTLLLTSADMRDAEPLVSSVRDGRTAYHGVVFVEDASPYKSIMDLQGARAAWVSETSASGYIFARLALASYGIDPRTLFASEEFLGAHGKVARAVLSGEADAGGVYAVFENGNPMRELLRAPFVDAVPGKKGRILFATPLIPADMIVGHKNLDASLSADLVSILEQLHHNRDAAPPVRHVLGAEAFIRFDPKALKPLREQVQTGRELGLIR